MNNPAYANHATANEEKPTKITREINKIDVDVKYLVSTFIIGKMFETLVYEIKTIYKPL